jgi:hypothetical protein
MLSGEEIESIQTPVASEQADPSRIGRVVGGVAQLVGRVLNRVLPSDGPVVVPEVNRGAFRVPFGTDPELASELVRDFRQRRRTRQQIAARRRAGGTGVTMPELSLEEPEDPAD